jgi:hypothetical protein
MQASASIIQFTFLPEGGSYGKVLLIEHFLLAAENAHFLHH